MCQSFAPPTLAFPFPPSRRGSAGCPWTRAKQRRFRCRRRRAQGQSWCEGSSGVVPRALLPTHTNTCTRASIRSPLLRPHGCLHRRRCVDPRADTHLHTHTLPLSPAGPSLLSQLTLTVSLPLGVVFEEAANECVCVEVDPQGNAAAAGIQVGDVLRVRCHGAGNERDTFIFTSLQAKQTEQVPACCAARPRPSRRPPCLIPRSARSHPPARRGRRAPQP